MAANASARPAVTPLEFMLGIMADPNVDPSLRFKAAQAAAVYVHPKPTGATVPDSGPLTIDVHRSIEDAALVAEAERQSILQQWEWLEECGGNPLTPEERAELKALNAKGEDLEAALPAHLKAVLSPEDQELRDLLADRRAAAPAHLHRKRPLSERQAIVERKGPPPSGDDGE